MNRSRWIALALLALLTLGSLGGSLGYAWYLRSDAYRRYCAAELSSALSLLSEIGEVVPRSRTAQEFRDVRVWLPERRDLAHAVERAILSYVPTPADPDAYEIELSGGTSEISTRTWLRSDYRSVIESSLRPGFTEDGPRCVRFSRMSLGFERERFHLHLSNAAGSVSFDSAERGRAAVTCMELNGYRSPEPIVLLADFSPDDGGVRLDHVELKVPNVPLQVANLRDLIGADVRSGRFHGTLVYRETAGERHIAVTGHCSDLELPECTSGLAQTPWRGRCPEIELLSLEIVNRQPRRVRFRGALSEVSLEDVLATWGLEGGGATVALQVGEADVSQEGIRRFVASGSCVDLSLEALSRALGYGVISGTLRATIGDLTIENDRIKSLSATLRVVDSDDSQKWIETALLREIARRALKIELPPIPVERLPYSELGVRLDVQDERVMLFGTHGEKEKTILTARLLGREVSLITEPRESFDASPWLDQLRQTIANRIRERLVAP
jgi:hypothetical protein